MEDSASTVKIEFYAPEENAGTIRLALGAAGFGKIGSYDSCASETKVRGYWRPLEGSKPHLGKQGEIFSGDEIKVEFLCERDRAADAVRLIRSLHPYEEPVIMVVPLLAL